MDRRSAIPRWRRKLGLSSSEANLSEEENDWRLEDRWKFDSDDNPAFGPGGPDEQDRELIDEFDTRSASPCRRFYRSD